MNNSIKRLLGLLVLTMILIIPFNVEAKNYKVVLSYFAQEGKVLSGNIEVYNNIVFEKDGIKADVTYKSTDTINHINSLDKKTTFTLKKSNKVQAKNKEWYGRKYTDDSKVYFSNAEKYKASDIIKKLEIDTSIYSEGESIEVFLYANYSNTTTSSTEQADKKIAVKSIKLNTSSKTIKVGDTFTLKETITPSDATNKDVTWKSSDTKIATVDSNGKVKGIKKGTTTITVSSNNGKTATCKVIVSGDNKIIFRYHKTGGTITPTTTNGNWDANSDGTIRSTIYSNSYSYDFHTASLNDKINIFDYNNPSYLKITKSGYIAEKNKEWCTKDKKVCFNQYSGLYTGEDIVKAVNCDLAKEDCIVNLYVNWLKPDQSIYYDDNHELGIGLFFTSLIKSDSTATGGYSREVDHRIGLYATNNGTSFKYIGETGIQGRDPDIINKNGVFYMLTTSNTKSENIVFNVYKSIDLVNWTEKNQLYKVGKNPKNTKNIAGNTWGANWVEIGNDLYVILATARYDDKGNKIIINEDNHLVAINQNGAVQYYINSDGSHQSNKAKAEKFNAPWKPYPMFDTFIMKVTDFGSNSNQEDINTQNLKFGTPQKIKFNGGKTWRSRIGADILKGSNNYVLYVKTDPFGSIERWTSNSLTGNWTRVDEGITQKETVNKAYTCIGKKVNHFEGNFFEKFNNNYVFYSDHYIYNNASEIHNNNNVRNNVDGIYYTITGNNIFGSNHIEYNNFRKVSISNVEMRPINQSSSIRNGTVKRIKTTTGKEKVRKASKHVISYTVEKDGSKKIIIIKSNRAISKTNNTDSIHNWSTKGWKYLSSIVNDSRVSSSKQAHYKNLLSSKARSYDQTFIYKVYESNKDINEIVKLTDKVGKYSLITIQEKN